MLKRYKYSDGLTAIPNGNGLLININGKVKHKNGDDVPIEYDSDGYRVVSLLNDARIIDIVAIVYKCFDLPIDLQSQVMAFHIDGDKDNLHAENVGYRFKGGKLEVPGFPGFYFIPGYLTSAINEKGELLNVKTKQFRNWYITKTVPKKNIKGGYRVVYVRSPSSTTTRLPRHRAMLLVFEGYPDNVDSLVTNHKDGVPGNDNLKNLEWCTRCHNNVHAYENDLKNQHMRVLVRNVLTGEVKEYRSISEAAIQVNLSSDESMRGRLYRSEFGQVFQDGTQVKFKSDLREWIIPDDPIKAIAENQEKIKVITKNCFTGEIQHHESKKDAAKKLAVELSAMEFQMKVNHLRPWRGYQIKLASDNREFPDFTLDEVNRTLENKLAPNRVIARNLFDDEILEFESVNSAEKYFKGVSVNYNLSRGNQPLTSDGWQVKLVSDDWEHIENVEERIYALNKEIMARHEDTGVITIASNAFKMGEKLNLYPKRIRLSAMTRGNEVYRGYRFRLGVNSEPWPTAIPSEVK